jgi:hypothetical protein
VLIGGETVALVDDDGGTYELEETVEEEPVAQDDLPTQASWGTWLAAAEPTRAATKSDNEACIVMEGNLDRVWFESIVSVED